MRPERPLIAERILANHCTELLAVGPSPVDMLARLAKAGERLARRLSGALAPLLGGEAPPVSFSAPREGDFASLRAGIAGLAANSLFGCGASEAPLLVSIEAEPILRIVDRAFGGKGEVSGPLPPAFPMAADLMIARIETILAGHIGAAMESVSNQSSSSPSVSVPPSRQRDDTPCEVKPRRRDGNLGEFAPLFEGQSLAIMVLEVDDGSVLPWLVTLAIPYATLGCLLRFALPAGSRTLPVRHDEARADATPFAEITLSLAAVLVDMTMPVRAVAALEVGQVLPVRVARAVPLQIGSVTLATGSVGAVDERIAIRVTQAFS